MDSSSSTRVVVVDKLDSGICIEFANGKSLIFTGMQLEEPVKFGLDVDGATKK